MMDEAPEGWRTLIKIPLPMAFITRYLWGTDKIRYFFFRFSMKIFQKINFLNIKIKFFIVFFLPLYFCYKNLKLFFLRNNAFEVRAVDGASTGIIHCEDKGTLDQWIKHIQNHITQLNQKSINLSNKYLHKNEQVSDSANQPHRTAYFRM